MSNIQAALRQLASYVDTTVTLDQIEEILDAGEPESIEDLISVKTARKQPEVLSILLDLCSGCRAARVSDALPNELDSWENLSNIIVPDKILGYLSSLIELGKIHPNDPIDLRLSLNSSNAYLLLLTVPGAKAVGAFDVNLVKRTLKLDHLLKAMPTLRENDKIYAIIQCVSLMQDLQMLLRYVSFEEEENAIPSLKSVVVKCVTDFVLHFHESSARGKYLVQLYDSCFGVLEDLCLPVQGDVRKSLKCILDHTSRLNKFVLRPHQNHQFSSNTPKFRSINCWFIEMLKKYPVQTAKVMKTFVICTLADCETAKQVQINDIDICVRYDSALLQAGNDLLDETLEVLATSEENAHRFNVVEFVSKVLQVDNERECTSDLPAIPREIKLIKILLLKTIDKINRIKIRATTALLNLLRDGSKKTVSIIKFLFSNIETARELKLSTSCTDIMANSETQADESPHATPTTHPFPGIEELWQPKDNFLSFCNQNLVHLSANVRKIGLLTLIFIASTSTNGIDKFLISKQFEMLHLDTSPMIRRQLVITMSTILGNNKSNDNVIDAYVRVCLNLAGDDDSKVVDAVTDSLKQNLFDNIRPYSQTSSDTHILPWRILSSILCSSKKRQLSCFKGSMKKNLVTHEILRCIETHIGTTNSSEAWNLLCMVAPKISSKNPEIVVSELLKQFNESQRSHYAEHDNLKDNSYEQMEVLLSWVNDLDRYSKTEVLRIITDLLMEGCVSHQSVQRIYELCYRICKNINESGLQNWMAKLKRRSEDYILKHIHTLGIRELYNNQLIGYLHTYVETVIDSSDVCNPKFVDALLEYLKVLEDHQFNDARAKVNTVQILLTKLSLFDYEICLKTVKSIGNLLNKSSNISIISNALICLIDLCKKHTSQVEVVLPFILSKMRHEHHNIRIQALKGVSSLLLEDFLKFRGPILIYVLAALSDDCAEIQTLAREVMVKFIVERNTVMLRSCLLEGPFVMNGYTYHDNLEIFTETDSSQALPLLGESHRKQRQYCYRFFINNMEIIECYMYFHNAHMLLDKVSNDTLIRTPEGLAAVSDLLYILSQICRMKEKSKKKASVVSGGDGGSDDDDAAHAETVVPGTSKGRPRHKGPTIEQALMVVEKVIPTIFTLDTKLRDINASLFGDCMNELCSAICEHFPALTDLAQPETFWCKYRTASTSNKQKAKPVIRNRRSDADELSSEDDEEFVRSTRNSSQKIPTKLTSNKQKSKPVIRNRRSDADELSSEDDEEFVRSKRKSSQKMPSKLTSNKQKAKPVIRNRRSDADELTSVDDEDFVRSKRNSSQKTPSKLTSEKRKAKSDEFSSEDDEDFVRSKRNVSQKTLSKLSTTGHSSQNEKHKYAKPQNSVVCDLSDLDSDSDEQTTVKIRKRRLMIND